ncbi:MAG: hypothetical protein GKR88_08310 [Flavobacteriaceae bacterium]|nr:MAG: hypothetical protein GKR88_08310 [Flavobacteriaceae bacterium]
MKKKQLIYAISGVLVAAAIWYFFIKKYDYRVTFETSNAPGVVYHKLSNWNIWPGSKAKKTQILSKQAFSKVALQIKENDSIMLIDWQFYSISDSITKVYACFKDKNHSIYQKFKLLFGKTDFVRKSIRIAKKIRNELKSHELKYKVSTPEKATIPEKYCACVSSSGKLLSKASQMIEKNPILLDFLRLNEIPITEYPLLQVTQWHQKKETIDFDFCFPIPKKKEYKLLKDIVLKTIPEREALKIVFNGNYMLSDRAWFSMIAYTARNRIAIELYPVEFYYNDPHSGTSELTWKTDVFFPLKQQ